MELVPQITPGCILSFNQVELPGAIPFLQLPLSHQGQPSRFMLLEPYQHLHAVRLGEARNRSGPMLPNPADEVVGHADVERAVPSARQDVHIEAHDFVFRPAFIRSFPRKRQSCYCNPFIPAKAGIQFSIRWVPACAGTNGVYAQPLGLQSAHSRANGNPVIIIRSFLRTHESSYYNRSFPRKRESSLIAGSPLTRGRTLRYTPPPCARAATPAAAYRSGRSRTGPARERRSRPAAARY
jgi:hypothetical protein